MYIPFGACFVGVGTEGSFKLSDIQLKGVRTSSDIIQTLETVKASVSHTYCYMDYDEAVGNGDADFQGWYDENFNDANDVTFSIGTGFLSCFGSSNVSIGSSGQVPSSGFALDCTGKTYVLFANFLPRKIKLGELVMNGAKTSSDIIQVLEPTRASVSHTYCYMGEEEAIKNGGNASDCGWYNDDFDNANDVEIEPGAALLASFGSPNVSIVFPSAVTTKE